MACAAAGERRPWRAGMAPVLASVLTLGLFCCAERGMSGSWPRPEGDYDLCLAFPPDGQPGLAPPAGTDVKACATSSTCRGKTSPADLPRCN